MRFSTKVKEGAHRFAKKHENTFRLAQKVGAIGLTIAGVGAAAYGANQANTQYNHLGNQAIVAESMSAIMRNKAAAHALAKSEGISYMAALHQLANEA